MGAQNGALLQPVIPRLSNEFHPESVRGDERCRHLYSLTFWEIQNENIQFNNDVTARCQPRVGNGSFYLGFGLRTEQRLHHQTRCLSHDGGIQRSQEKSQCQDGNHQ